MRFKTLEIQGFKSFPDKTVLEFDARTTAVVGRNGNGKSNISDALRWVMGEQGAKTLRGDKMEDVIFHGTEERRAMGYAKVALNIDNSDRRLLIDADEVVITRKLYRTGESEYLLNGEKTRLKDVHSLLMGTGLGKDGYSIIGQGRIEEIVNSKAANRREVFEEAAGVSKFLHQKMEAERELARAEENLLRLLDIENELQTRLPVLEKQAEKAKKARELMEEEKVLGVALSVRDLASIEKNLEAADNSILLNKGECEHFEREIEELDELCEEISENKRKNEAEKDRLNRKSDLAREEIEKINSEIALTASEISRGEGKISAIKEQVKLSEKSGEDLIERKADFKNQIIKIEEAIKTIDEKTVSANLELASFDNKNEFLDAENKELDKEIGELYQSKAAAEIYVSRAEENVSDLKTQLEEAKVNASERINEYDKLNQKKIDLKKNLDDLTEAKLETENKLSGYSRLYETRADKLDLAREEFERLRRDEHQKKSRYEALSDVERNMAGYYGSVKSVILAAKAGKLGGANEVKGTVADVVTADGEFALATEIALGSALQNIIVENEATAKRALRFLKESKAGRATFLPLTTIKGNVLEIAGLENEEGFLGLGHEIVRYEEKYSGIIKSLLGRTAFAEDIDAAAVIAKKYNYRFKIVTLDGQVINAGGSFTGGSSDKSAGIISRKRDIEILSSELQALNIEIETSKANYKQLEAQCAKMKLEVEGMREELAKTSGEELRLTAELSGVRDMLDRFEEEKENSETILNRFEKRVLEENATIEKYKSEIVTISEKLSEKEKIASEKSEALEAAANKRREISEILTALNIERLSKSKDAEGLNLRIAELDRSSDALKTDSKTFLKEVEDLEKTNANLEKEIEAKKAEISEINAKFSDNKNEIAELIKNGELLEKQSFETQSLIREKTEAKVKFSSALAAAVEKKDNLENNSEKIKTALWENYSLTPTEAIELASSSEFLKGANFEDNKTAASANAKLAEIRRKLKSLGDVNFAAIEEFLEVKERHEKLSEQLNDVKRAKRELEKLISDLTQDIRAKFLESFNEINKHFAVIFSEMFNGGNARLELTNPDDVLNSGVEIYAAPPGKVINNLISLSGGEKALVAITLYFSILARRPTPFCMLDEVDAALDEVNVSQYVSYIKKYSASTQLMMITHRRSTIEGCDVLYGVFMQEKGVSRLLKQELTDLKETGD